ncbi:class II aldolase/adducin family protein [Eudoraea adriatica]|uniref:class II aldolase/adducin family protein n=1 Tax=Eudoraea adriatica TaxID=446681 RepID=UPI000364D3F4|nr:class II aldolase/adducin family protein [Eudoraea adriatica]
MENKEALEALIKMSKYAGQRFDLVQAGGGNTSVKFGDYMYIKASGYLLSELTKDTGHTIVKTEEVVAILRDDAVLGISDKKEKDATASKKLQMTKVNDGPRPSIETYLHALLYKYTLHVHSISVNMFTSHQNWLQKMAELDSEALYVCYETPGIELALELQKQMEVYKTNFGRLPHVIFLQNHGLIISSDNYEDIEVFNEKVVVTAEKKAGIDFSRYRDTTKIANSYNETFQREDIAYLSEDAVITELLNALDPELLKKPFSPDGYVFCGYTMLNVDELQTAIFRKYQELYFDAPKIVRYNESLYIMAEDLKKAKMIEDVFKNNLLIANTLGYDLEFLEDSEISYLGNWEAEKYRQKL